MVNIARTHRRSRSTAKACALAGWFGLLLCLVTISPVSASAQSRGREYDVKAVFLFNFAHFVEWPPAAFAGSNTPLCIAVLGENTFGKALDETIRGESIQNRKLRVQYFRKVEDVKNCQLLFVSKSEKARLNQILTAVKSQPILTVSDIEDFATRGGVIKFFPEGSQLRFQINPTAATQAGLKLSSQLLSLGKIVNPGE